MSKTKLRQLDAAQNQCLRTIAGAYKSTPIAVLEHEMGFLPIQIHLKELAVAYAEKIQEGPAKKYIKRECNTIWAIIAHQFQPRIKPPMWPTRRDKLKKMAATITGINVQPADLFEVQYRKSRRAKVWKAFKKWCKREWEKYQSILTYCITAQAEP